MGLLLMSLFMTKRPFNIVFINVSVLTMYTLPSPMSFQKMQLSLLSGTHTHADSTVTQLCLFFFPPPPAHEPRALSAVQTIQPSSQSRGRGAPLVSSNRILTKDVNYVRVS